MYEGDEKVNRKLNVWMIVKKKYINNEKNKNEKNLIEQIHIKNEVNSMRRRETTTPFLFLLSVKTY